jgi:hypothetical protein
MLGLGIGLGELNGTILPGSTGVGLGTIRGVNRGLTSGAGIGLSLGVRNIPKFPNMS